ncbi:hypothetical protein WNY37_17985 [Henriciella sp. AS95]|uniref:hypothetical protein n=1 Tax=Henriciella sp. AS95 TaxID=3135782 RepID=UPI0031794313
MTHRLSICLFALAFPLAQTAVSQQPSEGVVGTGGDEMDRLPAELDTFVQEAIDQGLLKRSAPVGTGPSDTSGPRVLTPSPAQAAPAETPVPEHVSLRPRQDTEVQTGCAITSAYDFSDFEHFETYADLMSWRGVIEAEETATSKTLLAKAYLVLGMNEEARMQLVGKTDKTATALRELAWLMEGRAFPNISYFTEMTDCDEQARIWLALAKLRAGDPAGADILSTQINAYRHMPLRLRVNYTALAMPALDRMKERTLNEKLLATFTNDEIEYYSRLKFTKAMFDFSRRAPGSEQTMRDYFNHLEYRDEAGAALRRAGLDVDSDYETEFVSRLVDDYGKLPEDIPVEASLDVLLRDLNQAADYKMTLQLASVPAAQSPEARARLADHYSGLVAADLASAKTLWNIRGMDALLNSEGLLEGREDLDAKLGQAAALAAHLGLRTMSEKLSARLESDEALAVAQADLAYRLADSDQLMKLVERNAGNQHIIELAALDAVRTGNARRFAVLSGKLPDDAAFALRLVETDAASGHQIVPDRFYQRARNIEDEADARTLEQIMTARKALADASKQPTSIALADVPTSLTRVGASLQASQTEMR